MESPLPKRKRFPQTSDNIRRSTADKLKLFESIRGKEVANTPFWDIIVITALDESQRDAYDIQLQSKLSRGELPLGVKYHVFYDPPGPKIGNGGSVLVTIGDLLKIYSEEELMKSKILMLPAGGYSQRLPNASVLGKAFTALPTGTYVNPALTLWEQPVLSVCLKANLDGAIFAYDYCVQLACICGGKGGEGGLLPYKSDWGACRTFWGFKFLDW